MIALNLSPFCAASPPSRCFGLSLSLSLSLRRAGVSTIPLMCTVVMVAVIWGVLCLSLSHMHVCICGIVMCVVNWHDVNFVLSLDPGNDIAGILIAGILIAGILIAGILISGVLIAGIILWRVDDHWRCSYP